MQANIKCSQERPSTEVSFKYPEMGKNFHLKSVGNTFELKWTKGVRNISMKTKLLWGSISIRLGKTKTPSSSQTKKTQHIKLQNQNG